MEKYIAVTFINEWQKDLFIGTYDSKDIIKSDETTAFIPLNGVKDDILKKLSKTISSLGIVDVVFKVKDGINCSYLSLKLKPVTPQAHHKLVSI